MKIYSMYNVDYSLYPQFSFHCGLGLFTGSPTGKYNYTKSIGNTSNSNDMCSMRWADQVGLVPPNDNENMEIFLSPPETMNNTNMSGMIQDRYPKQHCELVCSIIQPVLLGGWGQGGTCDTHRWGAGRCGPEPPRWRPQCPWVLTLGVDCGQPLLKFGNIII